MVKKIILGIVALYLVSAGTVAVLLSRFDSAAVAVRRKVAELGEKHAPLPTQQMKPLAEACAGKLTAGGPRSIAAYVAKIAPTQMPALQKDYWHVDQTVIGVHEVFRLELDDQHLKEIPDARGPRIEYVLDPTMWSHHLKWSRAGSPELSELKYLVVARYESLTMPVVSGSTFEAGKGSYGARVLAFPSGEVLCEGKAELGMTSTVSAGGRGATNEEAQFDAASKAADLVPFVFTQAVIASPLHELCSTGGTQLCELTAYWVKR